MSKEYSGVFLRRVGERYSGEDLTLAWVGKSSASVVDLAFWTFALAMLCHVLDYAEYRTTTGAPADSVASLKVLAAYHDRLAEWEQTAMIDDLRRLLPSIYESMEKDSLEVFGTPLGLTLKQVVHLVPPQTRLADDLEANRKKISALIRDRKRSGTE